jgi:hypothetical protein
MSTFVLGIEGPDDETLDALENLLRQKGGWDPSSQRQVHLQHLKRMSTADFPKGYELGPWKADPPLPEPADPKLRRYVIGGTWELKTPAGPLVVRAQETNNYAEKRNLIVSSGYKPGDLLLTQNFVILHVAAPEAMWDTLEALEPVFRKRLRLGPPSIEDLPDGFTADGKWNRLWYETTRERAQLRKFSEQTGLDASNLAAVRYERDGTALLFELKQPLTSTPPARPDWKVIPGRGRYVGAVSQPGDAAEAEAVRGIVRGKK